MRSQICLIHAEKVERIIDEIVLVKYDIEKYRINEKTRHREVVEPRQIYHYFFCMFTKMSTTKIGLKFGNRDHATVLHSKKTIERLIQTEKYLNNIVNEIKAKLLDEFHRDELNKLKIEKGYPWWDDFK